MKLDKNKLLNCIIISFVFTFNICIFAPLEFYYINAFDLWFTVDYILPNIAIISVITLITTFLITYLTKGKVHNFFVKLFFILLVSLYIQGNYLNFGYEVLDGSAVEWNTMIVKGIINTIIWLSIVVILIFLLKKMDIFRFISNLSSAFILGIQIITLIIIILFAYVQGADQNLNIDAPFYLDTNNMFDLSKEENIIVFLSDTFESTYMKEIIENYPEFKTSLKDFVYFDNATGTSLMTYSAMPTILTGEVCQLGNNLKENIKYCYDNTQVYDILKDNGYDVELYTDINLIPSDEDKIDNKVDKKLLIDNKSKAKLSGLLYKCVFYKYMPHFLKSGFLVNTSDFNKVNSVDVNQYAYDDVKFNNRLVSEGITTETNNKMFKLYHLLGTHMPYFVTKDIEYDYSKEYNEKDATEKRMNQTYASLKILENYVKELKNSGVYDQTTIILLADHGWENRYYVNLLVKPKNNTSEFTVSNAPVSILEDYIPTILNIASNSKDYGKDIWDYKNDDVRERNIYNYTFTRGDNTYNVVSKVTITTKDHADDIDKYYISKQEFLNTNETPQKEYKLGKKVDILNNKNMKYITMEGLLGNKIRTIKRGTNIGTEARIKVNTSKSNLTNDVKAKFVINEVFYDNQNLIISNGDKTLFEGTFNVSDTGKEIEFSIPKDMWNANEIFELKLNFPDGKLGDPAALGEETVFMSMLIESVMFYE